jgi:hypothetical protein
MVLKRKFASAVFFAVLAILALCFAIAAPSYPDILYGPITVTTLFLSPRSLLFTIALASAFSALLYLVLSPSQSSSLNRLLALAHFVLLAVALLVAAEAVRSWSSALSYASQAGATTYIVWHFPMVQVGFMVVGLGCVIFLVNLGMAFIRRFR